MLWLSTFLYHLILCEYIFRSVKASGRIRRTIVGRFPLCPRGCTACSPVNGCVACEDSLYLFLHRQNAREIGICTLSCPVGYYRQREQYFNKCVKCHIRNCYNCFSRQFCVMCESPYLLYGGQCVESCPNGLYYANFTNECKDRVDCIPGGWSPWTECTRNGQTCGFRYGTQTRTRPVLQPASANGEPCPALTDSQRCQLAQRHCDEAHRGGATSHTWPSVSRGPPRYVSSTSAAYVIAFYALCSRFIRGITDDNLNSIF